jgi:hypothetical protein
MSQDTVPYGQPSRLDRDPAAEARAVRQMARDLATFRQRWRGAQAMEEAYATAIAVLADLTNTLTERA